jgi:hypothetical protein
MVDLRTFYRKLPHENVWHFCRKCENWPQFGYGERDDMDSHSVTFCARCIEHHRTSQCEWLHLELSPGPLSLRSQRGDVVFLKL